MKRFIDPVDGINCQQGVIELDPYSCAIINISTIFRQNPQQFLWCVACRTKTPYHEGCCRVR